MRLFSLLPAVAILTTSAAAFIIDPPQNWTSTGGVLSWTTEPGDPTSFSVIIRGEGVTTSGDSMTGQFLGRANSPPGAYVADQTMINSSASPVELMTFCDYLLPSTNQPRWEIFVFNTTLDKSSGRFAIAPNTTAGCLEMGPPKPASDSVAPESAGSAGFAAFGTPSAIALAGTAVLIAAGVAF